MKPIAFMRLRHLDDPEDILKKYKSSDLAVEQKYDGFKEMASKDASKVRIISRNGKDVTANASAIAEELEVILPPNTSVLGEMVYISKGKQELGLVQSILHSAQSSRAKAMEGKHGGRLVFIVYDVIEYRSKDASKMAWSERRKIVEKLFKSESRGSIRRSKTYPWSKRKQAMRDALKCGGEGIVVKVKSSPYIFRKRGSSEPFGEWWKHKVPGEKAHSEDVLLLGYEKREKRLSFRMYQFDSSGNKVFVGFVSNLPRDTEKEVQRMSDRGRPIVAEITHQERFPSGKFRHPGWSRLRPDKPHKSATITRKTMARNPQSAREKEYTVYLVQEKPRGLVLYSFNSGDLLSPNASASEYAWLLGESALEKSGTHIFTTEAKLRRFLRRNGDRRIVRGRQRYPNPRNSKVKDALAAEATRYEDFNEFSNAYWNACSRGLYWVATNERRFHIGLEERQRIKKGTFTVHCSPALALSGRNEGKKYVAELDVTKLPKGALEAKKRSGGAQISIVSHADAVDVMRVLEAPKAKRAFKWQLSILPSSKEELREIWKKAWAKRKREAEKLRIKKGKQLERELKRSEARAKEDAKSAARAEKRALRKAESEERARVSRSKASRKRKESAKRTIAAREDAKKSRRKAADSTSRQKKEGTKKPSKKKGKRVILGAAEEKSVFGNPSRTRKVRANVNKTGR